MTRLLILSMLAGSISFGKTPPPSPLHLEDVLRSVESSYPLLLAAIQERAMAEGKLLSASGAFDATLTAKSGTNQFGFYKNRMNGVEVAQPLQELGGEFFGGYKRGQGNFGPWEQDLLSLSGGEWNGGVRLPLFRNRTTDERRTELALAQLSVELAGASVQKQRLKLLETAAKSYWSWVAAGSKLEIAEELLALAEERTRQVEESIAEGQIAAIEGTDNQRAILQRRAAAVSAGRELQRAAYELSLFYRDDAGLPITPSRERVSGFPEPRSLSTLDIESDLARALEARPEIEGVLVERRQADASLRLARNRALPQVDLSVSYSRDSGVGSITKRGSEMIANLSFKTPFQRRKAKGEIALQQAKAEQLGQKLRFALDRVSVEVRDAVSALEAARNRLELARAELEAARRLAAAERERFELGDSTLFMVNLRELSAAEARFKVVSAIGDFHKGLASYRTATVGW